jgi:hypothetical protein
MLERYRQSDPMSRRETLVTTASNLSAPMTKPCSDVKF